MNITHTRGDTYIRNLSFKTATGTPINLTNYSIKFTMRADIEGEVIITKNLTITDAVNGLANLTLSASEMNLAVKNYYFDFQLTTSDSRVITFDKGLFNITYDITR